MSYYVRSHTFCCCIPVRLGVFIISILGVGLGGLLAVAGIVQLKNLGDVPMKEKWPGYSLYHYFQDSPNVVADCINGSTDEAMIETCKQGEDVVKGVMVGVFIFVWIMELCKFDVGNSDLSYLSLFCRGYLHREGVWLSIGRRNCS
ncbi:hypothetical protein F5050DRAFT_733911 [Lentinula boryana]|uniref:Uncharacterized protein n=1 Tax=Lentinula boryana TaxID=40481 RepID=A0ABQ8QMY4_9AGAR|nr:hypothetical protein F5050DRAFT_733911 [Lentinula boryana]